MEKSVSPFCFIMAVFFAAISYKVVASGVSVVRLGFAAFLGIAAVLYFGLAYNLRSRNTPSMS